MNEVIINTQPPWRTTIVICKTAVNFKIDSGADTTIIHKATYDRLREKPKLRPVKSRLDNPGNKANKGQFLAKTKVTRGRGTKDYHFRMIVAKS